MYNNSDLSIVVVSYDGYSDLWEDFFTLKNQNWANCPYPTYLANNVKNFQFKDVNVINCGLAAQWSDRARFALQNINTKYVCLMVEDFFISDVVSNDKFKSIISFMEKENICFYKLQTMSKIKTPYFNGIKGLRVIPSNLPYGVSLTTAIWDREYLLSLIGPDSYNPWKFEINMVKQAEMAKEPFTCVGVFDETDPLHICHMVVQGKYIPSSLAEMKKRGYEINTSGRKTLSIVDVMKRNIKAHCVPLAQKMPLLRTLGKYFGIESIQRRES